MRPQYDTKTDHVIYDTDAIGEFEDADFVRLAMACIDQAGIAQHRQAKIAAILREQYPDFEAESNRGAA